MKPRLCFACHMFAGGQNNKVSRSWWQFFMSFFTPMADRCCWFVASLPNTGVKTQRAVPSLKVRAARCTSCLSGWMETLRMFVNISPVQLWKTVVAPIRGNNVQAVCWWHNLSRACASICACMWVCACVRVGPVIPHSRSCTCYPVSASLCSCRGFSCMAAVFIWN